MISLERQLEPVLAHLPPEERAKVIKVWPQGHPVVRILLDQLGGDRAADRYPALARALAEEADRYALAAPYQMIFREMVAAEPGVRGRVIDIGCAGELPGALTLVPSLCTQLDGVDPSPAVHQHPNLTLRWEGRFEDADIPSDAYDLAYAYNVVEHVDAARPFFEKLRRVLKPGGVFLAATPHANHLFARLSRAVEVMRGKHFMAKRNPAVNDYPAYYRLNSEHQVRRATEGLGFEATFHYFTVPGWGRGYFPRGLRWVPRTYDWAIGERFERAALIVIYRLRRVS